MDRVTLQAGDVVRRTKNLTYEQRLSICAAFVSAGASIRRDSSCQSVAEHDYYSANIAFTHRGELDHGVVTDGYRALTVDQVLNATNAHPPAPVIDVGSGEWNGEGLPTAGIECEIKHKDATEEWAQPDFHYAKIKAIGDEMFILESGDTCNGRKESCGIINDYLFRPIQSERDKVIEAASKLIPTSSESAYKAMKIKLGKLYDGGHLKLPED